MRLCKTSVSRLGKSVPAGVEACEADGRLDHPLARAGQQDRLVGLDPCRWHRRHARCRQPAKVVLVAVPGDDLCGIGQSRHRSAPVDELASSLRVVPAAANHHEIEAAPIDAGVVPNHRSRDDTESLQGRDQALRVSVQFGELRARDQRHVGTGMALHTRQLTIGQVHTAFPRGPRTSTTIRRASSRAARGSELRARRVRRRSFRCRRS